MTLNVQQRTRIRETILTGRNVPRVDRVNFRLRVGIGVPAYVNLVAVPPALIEVYPAWRGYQYFVVDDDIVIVNDGREIVSVVSDGPVQASDDSVAVQSEVAAADFSEPEIRALQTVLIERGVYDGEVDGVFGPNTREALIVFQRREGLEVTGRIDTRTVSRLDLSSRITVRETERTRTTVDRDRDRDRDQRQGRDDDQRQRDRDRADRPQDRDRADRDRAQQPRDRDGAGQDRDRGQQARDRNDRQESQDDRRQARDPQDGDRQDRAQRSRQNAGQDSDDRQPRAGQRMQSGQERGMQSGQRERSGPATTGEAGGDRQPRSGQNERSGNSGRSMPGQSDDQPAARTRDGGSSGPGMSGGQNR